MLNRRMTWDIDKKLRNAIWLLTPILVGGAILACVPFAHADAPSTLYTDGVLTLTHPDGVLLSACTDELAQKAGKACFRIGQTGDDGAIFITVHEGYALASHTALSQHLASSEGALTDVRRVRVLQSRILSDSPLVGVLEVEREDRGIAELLTMNPPIRQTSFLYPHGSLLVQVFVYLSMNSPQEELYRTLFEAFSHPQIDENALHSEKSSGDISANAQNDSPNGIRPMLPRALLFGAILAILGIAFLHIRKRLTQKNKDY